MQGSNGDAAHGSCVLCSLYNSSDPLVIEITDYIAEAVGNVTLNAICAQVKINLLHYCQTTESVDNIHAHITHHMTDQRVVLVNILRDLVELSTATRQSCVMTCEDTGIQAIDTKGLMAYLKTIDQITSIYKMEVMKGTGRKDS